MRAGVAPTASSPFPEWSPWGSGAGAASRSAARRNPALLSGAGGPSLATCPVLATPDIPQVRGPGWRWAEVGLTVLSRWWRWSEPLPRLPLSCRLNLIAEFTGCFGEGRPRGDPSETPVEVRAELWAGLQGCGQEPAPPSRGFRAEERKNSWALPFLTVRRKITTLRLLSQDRE